LFQVPRREKQKVACGSSLNDLLEGERVKGRLPASRKNSRLIKAVKHDAQICNAPKKSFPAAGAISWKGQIRSSGLI